MVVENMLDEKLKRLEKKHLKKESPIRLEGIKKPDNNLMDDALFCLMKKQSEVRNFYEDNTQLGLGPHGRRSAGDLFLIMKYYYPEVTFKEVRQLIFNLLNDHRICTDYCYTIEKRVYFIWKDLTATNQNVYSSEDLDEYKEELKIV